MVDPLVIVDTSDVRAGRLEDVKAAFSHLAAFVEGREPRAAVYHVYFSDDGSRVTVLQVHPDAASAEAHMVIAAGEFAGFADLLTLRTLDVYGRPSAGLLERLRAKARMLGEAKLVVHEPHAGFLRLRGT